MIAIFKREIKHYLKRPLFWIGIVIVAYEVFSAISPYLATHYLEPGEEIINEYPDTSNSGEVYEGYIPSNSEEQREIWNEKVKQVLVDKFKISESEAQVAMEKIKKMDLTEASAYIEKEYKWYGAYYLYQEGAYHKGTPEEINAYLDEKMENETFSFYFSRKFADFTGLFMGFFATIMLSVLFLQDTRKHTYELLHTKPITAPQYVLGKVSVGFGGMPDRSDFVEFVVLDIVSTIYQR